MELYAHIYKSKLGNLYLLQSTRIDVGDKVVFYWTGCMVTHSGSDIIMLPSCSVVKGENKKDVLSKINEREKKFMYIIIVFFLKLSFLIRINTLSELLLFLK